MNIAKVVSSNSHVEYIARVVDSLDVSEPPDGADYGFGRFVKIESVDGEEIVGVVFNSILVNPDYAGFGPRLSPKPELESFSPDFLNEQGVLLAILLLGTIGGPDSLNHGIPGPVIPAGQNVTDISDDEILDFHTDSEGRLNLRYYSQLLTHAGSFAIPLLENIIGKLSDLRGPADEDVNRLAVLRRSLVWQRTVGQMRL